MKNKLTLYLRLSMRDMTLQGHQLITKVFDGLIFTNGIEETVAA